MNYFIIKFILKTKNPTSFYIIFWIAIDFIPIEVYNMINIIIGWCILKWIFLQLNKQVFYGILHSAE